MDFDQLAAQVFENTLDINVQVLKEEIDQLRAAAVHPFPDDRFDGTHDDGLYDIYETETPGNFHDEFKEEVKEQIKEEREEEYDFHPPKRQRFGTAHSAHSSLPASHSSLPASRSASRPASRPASRSASHASSHSDASRDLSICTEPNATPDTRYHFVCETEDGKKKEADDPVHVRFNCESGTILRRHDCSTPTLLRARHDVNTLDVSNSPGLLANDNSFVMRADLPRSTVRNLIMCNMGSDAERLRTLKYQSDTSYLNSARPEFDQFNKCKVCHDLNVCVCYTIPKREDSFANILAGTLRMTALVHLDVRRNYLDDSSTDILIHLVRHSQTLRSFGFSLGRRRGRNLERQHLLLETVMHSRAVQALRLHTYKLLSNASFMERLPQHFHTIGLSGTYVFATLRSFFQSAKRNNVELNLFEMTDVCVNGKYTDAVQLYFNQPCARHMLFDIPGAFGDKIAVDNSNHTPLQTVVDFENHKSFAVVKGVFRSSPVLAAMRIPHRSVARLDPESGAIYVLRSNDLCLAVCNVRGTADIVANNLESSLTERRVLS